MLGLAMLFDPFTAQTLATSFADPLLQQASPMSCKSFNSTHSTSFLPMLPKSMLPMLPMPQRGADADVMSNENHCIENLGIDPQCWSSINASSPKRG